MKTAEPMIELHSLDDVILSDGAGRTPLARETVCIAYMLLSFEENGAELGPHLGPWARQTLAQNGELRPDQVRRLLAEVAAE